MDIAFIWSLQNFVWKLEIPKFKADEDTKTLSLKLNIKLWFFCLC